MVPHISLLAAYAPFYFQGGYATSQTHNIIPPLTPPWSFPIFTPIFPRVCPSKVLDRNLLPDCWKQDPSCTMTPSRRAIFPPPSHTHAMHHFDPTLPVRHITALYYLPSTRCDTYMHRIAENLLFTSSFAGYSIRRGQPPRHLHAFVRFLGFERPLHHKWLSSIIAVETWTFERMRRRTDFYFEIKPSEYWIGERCEEAAHGEWARSQGRRIVCLPYQHHAASSPPWQARQLRGSRKGGRECRSKAVHSLTHLPSGPQERWKWCSELVLKLVSWMRRQRILRRRPLVGRRLFFRFDFISKINLSCELQLELRRVRLADMHDTFADVWEVQQMVDAIASFVAIHNITQHLQIF